LSARHILMIERTSYIDWIVVQNETEALILEDILIKKHRPDFNVRFRDDKRYPLIRLNMRETFPTLTVVRNTAKDGALYYGPYTSSRTMRMILNVINRYFPLRRCSDKKRQIKAKSCLHYEMGRCAGVCLGTITSIEYMKIAKQVRFLLEGKNEELAVKLTQKMTQASESLDFEAAVRYRDQLKAIRKISGGRKLLLQKSVDIDVFVFENFSQDSICQLLYIRGGFISGKRTMWMEAADHLSLRQMAEKFLIRYYRSGYPAPREILVSDLPESIVQVEQLIQDVSGRSVTIHQPKRGIKARLIQIAYSNIRHNSAVLDTRQLDKEKVAALSSLLELTSSPTRIEAIDISESHGKLAVGSLVVFIHGKAEKKLYRRFRIKDRSARSDLDRISEVVERRFKRIGEKGWETPDLLIIDGGKTQLAAAITVLNKLDIGSETMVISLVKARNNRQSEAVFLPNLEELILNDGSQEKLLLDRIRDEAHRFAILYHRQLRESMSILSTYLEIPGVGPKRKAVLIRHIGSYNQLKKATVTKIASIPGIGLSTARRIKAYLNSL